MGKTETKLNPSADPFGFDIFESVETYEDLMGTLAGVYFQLWFQEQKKPVEAQKAENLNKYMKRHSEIRTLKKSFPISAIKDRNKAIDLYTLELEGARKLLEQKRVEQI